MLNSIDSVEYDGDNTVIIFDNNDEKLINNLKKMIDENDTENGTNIIGDGYITSEYGPRKRVKTLKTPTTLELLFVLLKNLESNSQVTPSKKSTTVIRTRQFGQDSKQPVKENIKKKIMDITSDFINQIGLGCGNESFLNVPFLNSLFQLDPPTSDSSTSDSSNNVKMDLSKKRKLHSNYRLDSSTSDSSTSDSSTSGSSNYVKMDLSETRNSSSISSSLPPNPGTGYLFPRLTSRLQPHYTRKIYKSANREIGKNSNFPSITSISANSNKTGSSHKATRPVDPKSSNYSMRPRRNGKGGSKSHKPKFTRRKTTKSPKRKTIKKRKMPKRKNKTRRNK